MVNRKDVEAAKAAWLDAYDKADAAEAAAAEAAVAADAAANAEADAVQALINYIKLKKEFEKA